MGSYPGNSSGSFFTEEIVATGQELLLKVSSKHNLEKGPKPFPQLSVGRQPAEPGPAGCLGALSCRCAASQRTTQGFCGAQCILLERSWERAKSKGGGRCCKKQTPVLPSPLHCLSARKTVTLGQSHLFPEAPCLIWETEQAVSYLEIAYKRVGAGCLPAAQLPVVQPQALPHLVPKDLSSLEPGSLEIYALASCWTSLAPRSLSTP